MRSRRIGNVEVIKEGPGEYYLVRDGERRPVPSVTTVTSLVKGDLSRWAVREALLPVFAPTGQSNSFRALLLERGLPEGEEGWNELLSLSRRAPKRKAEEAADRGTRLHAWVEGLLKGEASPPPPDLEGACRALEGLLRELRVEPLRMEEIVAHLELDYAGTVDLLGKVDGGLAVLDYKLTGGVFPAHHLQVGGYALALQAEGVPVETGYILHLDRDGRAQAHPVDLREAIRAFRGVLEVWRFIEGWKVGATGSSPRA